MPSPPPAIRHVTHFQCLSDLPCVRFAALYSFFSSIFYHFSVRLLFLVNESCGFEFHTKYERLLFRMNEWRGFQCLLHVLYLLDQSIDLFVLLLLLRNHHVRFLRHLRHRQLHRLLSRNHRHDVITTSESSLIPKSSMFACFHFINMYIIIYVVERMVVVIDVFGRCIHVCHWFSLKHIKPFVGTSCDTIRICLRNKLS